MVPRRFLAARFAGACHNPGTGDETVGSCEDVLQLRPWSDWGNRSALPLVINMLHDVLDSELASRGCTCKRTLVRVFGDLCWDTPGPQLAALARTDPAVVYETAQRYVALHRFPEGIRYLGAPAPLGRPFDSGNEDVFEIGTLPTEGAAADFVYEWLSGTPGSQIGVPRAHR